MKTPDFSNTVLAFSGKQSIYNNQPIDEVTLIDISSVVGFVELITTDETNVTMEVYLDNMNYLAKFTVGMEKHGNKISCFVKKRNLFFTIVPKRVYVKILVPKAFTQKILISSVCGRVMANEITCKRLEASVVSGEILIANCVATSMDVSNVTGTTELLDVSTDCLSVHGKSSDIKIDSLSFTQESPSEADISIASVTGTVKLSTVDCYKNVTINAVTSSIEARFPTNYRYNEEVSTVSGRIVRKSCDASIEGRSISENNKIRMDIVTGEITIYR